MAEGRSNNERLAAMEERQARLLSELDSLDRRVLEALEGASGRPEAGEEAA